MSTEREVLSQFVAKNEELGGRLGAVFGAEDRKVFVLLSSIENGWEAGWPFSDLFLVATIDGFKIIRSASYVGLFSGYIADSATLVWLLRRNILTNALVNGKEPDEFFWKNLGYTDAYRHSEHNDFWGEDLGYVNPDVGIELVRLDYQHIYSTLHDHKTDRMVVEKGLFYKSSRGSLVSEVEPEQVRKLLSKNLERLASEAAAKEVDKGHELLKEIEQSYLRRLEGEEIFKNLLG